MSQSKEVCLEYSDHQKSNSRYTINDLPIEFSRTSTNYSIEALMKKIKPVNPEKHDFDYRDESITKTSYIFWQNRCFDANNKLNDF